MEKTAGKLSFCSPWALPCPITTDETVWAAYIDMYCKGMDEEHRACWEEFFASCMQPIPFGWTSIAGYWNYCDGHAHSR